MKRHQPTISRAAAFIVAISLAACSGSGTPSNPIPAHAPIATSSAPASASSKTRATFVIHWPSAAQAAAASRRRNTISPSTQSISVTVNGGSPTVVNKPTLTGSPSTTSISIYAPPGDDGFTFTAWDQLDAGGAILDQSTVNQVILADANNTVSVALDGVCAALVPTLTQTGTYVQYTNATVPLASGSRTVLKSARMIGNFPKVFQFTRVDADGNTILTSAGSAPILVTESGSTPHVTIVPVATGGANTTFTITPILAEPDGVSTTVTATSPDCGTGTATFPNSFQLSTSAEVVVAYYYEGILTYDQDGVELQQLATHAQVPNITGLAYNPNSGGYLVAIEPKAASGGIAFQTLSLSGSVLGSSSFTPQNDENGYDEVASSESPANIVYDPKTGYFYIALQAYNAGTSGDDGTLEEYSISGSTAKFVNAVTNALAPSRLAVLPNGDVVENDLYNYNSNGYYLISSIDPNSLELVADQAFSIVSTSLAVDSTRGTIVSLNTGTTGNLLEQDAAETSLFLLGKFSVPNVDGGYITTAAYSQGNDELYAFAGGPVIGLSGATIPQGGSSTSNLPATAFSDFSDPQQAVVIP